MCNESYCFVLQFFFQSIVGFNRDASLLDLLWFSSSGCQMVSQQFVTHRADLRPEHCLGRPEGCSKD